MSRKALVVGINDYPGSPLTGCVADAVKMEAALSVNGDGSANFSVERLSSDIEEVKRSTLRGKIEKLFSGDTDVEVALFYFSGHGIVTSTGGVIVTQDFEKFDEGLSMANIVEIANKSKAQNKVIILDCCYSGDAGAASLTVDASIIGKGTTIMTASLDTETAEEVDSEGGLFTTYITEGLQGGAADVRGRITPASLYSYVDEAMGAWEQRPVFKSNIHKFIHLRQVPESVPDGILRKLPEYFKEPSSEHNVDPSYEPERNGSEIEKNWPEPDPAKNVIFADLQKLVAASLVVPVGASSMWHAATGYKSCKLTAVGAQYWRMSKRGHI